MGWFNRGKKEKTAGIANNPTTSVKTARDPVCGMAVNVDTAAARSVYGGQTSYFCSAGCKTSFDGDPAKYLGGKVSRPTGQTGHHHHM